MCPHQQVIDALRSPTKGLRSTIPEVWEGFQALHRAAMAEGDIPTRLNESVALAIAVVKRCDGCIAYHARAAARAGATADEVAEPLGGAVLLDGGTASVYALRAWEAFVEFADAAGNAADPITAAAS